MEPRCSHLKRARTPAWALVLPCLLLAAAPAQASPERAGAAHPGPTQQRAGSMVFVDGLNPDAEPDVQFYGAARYALPYSPPVDFYIERIECFHGLPDGTAGRAGDPASFDVRVEVRPDADGLPAPYYMTWGFHALEPEPSFQAADVAPALLFAGQQYWIILYVGCAMRASVGVPGTGDDIPYVYAGWSGWEPGPEPKVWIARFYGRLLTPVEASSWGSIKRTFTR